MPIYEYYCNICKEFTETSCRVEERDNQRCLKCNSLLKKQISLPGISFKGSGFYRNDYKRSGEKEFREEVSQELFKGDINTDALNKGKIEYTEQGKAKRRKK
jgi:putative FmdB family regulatory protein